MPEANKKKAFFTGGQGKFKVSPKETRTWEGRLYDSKLEMAFHQELLKHFSPDEIQLQVPFVLQPGFRSDWAAKWQAHILYRADFVLGDIEQDREGNNVPGPCSMVIDAKGMILPRFRTASRLFEYKHRKPLLAVKRITHLRKLIEIYKLFKQMDKTLIKRITSGEPFTVKGYTSSDGSVKDLRVQVIGRQGYLDRVRKSSEGLLEAARELFEDPEIQKAYDLETRHTVFSTVRDSLAKKLETVEDEVAAHRSKNENFEALSADVMLVDNDMEKIAALRLEVLEETEIQPPTKVPKKKATTVLREALEEKLPVSKYLHRINLYAGKYQAIE